MPVQYGDDVNLSQNQLLNAVTHRLTADPTTPVEGQFWYRTDLDRICYFDGTVVRRFSYRLDQLDSPTTSVSMGSQKITDLANPTLAQDAVTKNYADALLQGLKWKEPVEAVSQSGGVPTGTLGELDTIPAADLLGKRVLILGSTMTTPSTYAGIYIVSAGSWPRASDCDTAAELEGAAVYVKRGASYADTLWTQTTEPITLGTTAMSWIQFQSATSTQAGAGLTKTGNTLDLVAADGSLTISADSATVGNVPITKGGTGSTTAANARNALGAVGRYSTLVMGGQVHYVTHSLPNYVQGQGSITVTDLTLHEPVHVGIVHQSDATIAVDLSHLSSFYQYRITVIG